MIIRLDGDLAGEFATRLTVDKVSLGPSHGLLAGLARSAFSKLPIRLNVSINAPFRALIQMAKAFKDPTQAIAPVMPFPVDLPALKVEVLSTTKDEQQTQAKPATQGRHPAIPTTRRYQVTRHMLKIAKLAGSAACALALNGCVTVKPPDKPIEINLNVAIKQEVLVRLQQDVQQMISKNPQAFPPAPTRP